MFSIVTFTVEKTVLNVCPSLSQLPSLIGVILDLKGRERVVEVGELHCRQSQPYLFPSARQRLTLDHFFVAKAQLHLLPCASLSEDGE